MRGKILPLFCNIGVLRDQSRTGFMCIRQIELEPTDESVVQSVRETKNEFLVNRFDDVVYKAFECDWWHALYVGAECGS